MERVFLVPVDDVPENRGCLRWERAKNKQSHKIRWAQPYLLPVEPAQLVVGLEVLERVSSAGASGPPS